MIEQFAVLSNFFKTNDDVVRSDTVFNISAQNYTNVLQNVHEHIDDYVGQKIKMSGYIYLKLGLF